MKKCLLHVHTLASDGQFSRIQICEMLKNLDNQPPGDPENGFIVGFSDHNCVPTEEELERLRSAYSNWEFPLCCEFSSKWEEDIEIHVVGYDLKRTHELQTFLDTNKLSPKASEDYVEGILQKLRDLGIEMNENYRSMCEKYPDAQRISRRHIAQELVKQNVVHSVRDAYDIYIGDRGSQKAWIRKPLNGYYSLSETVGMIVNSGGFAVLAHIMAYKRAGVDDLKRLIAEFVAAGGIALELNTKEKDEHQTVSWLASDFGLSVCWGTDYHSSQDELEVQDNADFYIDLIKRRDAQGGK